MLLDFFKLQVGREYIIHVADKTLGMLYFDRTYIIILTLTFTFSVGPPAEWGLLLSGASY